MLISDESSVVCSSDLAKCTNRASPSDSFSSFEIVSFSLECKYVDCTGPQAQLSMCLRRLLQFAQAGRRFPSIVSPPKLMGHRCSTVYLSTPALPRRASAQPHL